MPPDIEESSRSFLIAPGESLDDHWVMRATTSDGRAAIRPHHPQPMTRRGLPAAGRNRDPELAPPLRTLNRFAVLDRLRADPAGPASDTVSIVAATAGCGNRSPGSGFVSPVKPSFDDNVATLTFPLDHPQVNEFLTNGAAVNGPSARVVVPFVAGPVADVTAPGRSFTVGQDVPPDVDCIADSEDPACQ